MKNKSILLVEDDRFLADLYKELLIAEGYSVAYAPDGKEAYDKLSKSGYDLVLLDIVMPKMDGIQVLEKLNKNYPDALKNKIVLLTNLGKNGYIDRANKLGIKGYIIKSDITPDKFIDVVKSYLK